MKRRTSINIDKDLWNDWRKFAIDQTGISHSASNLIEEAIKEYMKNHPLGHGE